MSRPKYWWYGNVLRVIRNYPALRAAKDAAQSVSTTANYNYSGLPGASAGRKTENSALRQLSPREEEDLAAVENAMERVSGEVLEVVRLYHWKGVRNFETVGDLLHMSRNTAKRRNSRFVWEVARNMGYLKKLG